MLKPLQLMAYLKSAAPIGAVFFEEDFECGEKTQAGRTFDEDVDFIVRKRWAAKLSCVPCAHV